MTTPLGLVVGLVAGIAFVRYAGANRRPYAVGLLAAAVIYAAFALAGGASVRWLLVETVGVALFGAVAWSGFRGWLPLLAVGWAAHVGWDVLLHLDGAGAVHTPGWYPWACVSLDLILAAALLRMALRREVAESRLESSGSEAIA